MGTEVTQVFSHVCDCCGRCTNSSSPEIPLMWSLSSNPFEIDPGNYQPDERYKQLIVPHGIYCEFCTEAVRRVLERRQMKADGQ